jgi:DNA-binding CsgD family transcriptional regulator
VIQIGVNRSSGLFHLRAATTSFLGRAAPSVAQELPDLSPRELEILGLVAAGLDNEGIASRLYLSVRTVERHLSNISTKFGVSGKAPGRPPQPASPGRVSRPPPERAVSQPHSMGELAGRGPLPGPP